MLIFDVSGKATLLGVGLRAEIALVGPFARMDADVLGKVFAFLEGLRAVSALVGLFKVVLLFCCVLLSYSNLLDSLLLLASL